MKFGEKLQKLRKENGLSQEQLAEKLNVSRQAISKWKIVGHIMFTKAKVGTVDVLALAPLSILPEYQKENNGA